MALEFMVEDIESVDENARGFYVADDSGKHYLDVNGAVSKSKVDEFRNNNIKLMKQLETYKDIDVEEYHKLRENALNGSSIGKEEVDRLLEERVKTMRAQFESDNNKLKDELGVSKSQLETLLVDSAVRQASSKMGVLNSAMDDVVLRAKSVFKVEDGKAVPYDKDGVIYNKDGSSPMPVTDWVKGLKKSAPHLFELSAGSGASGGRGGQRRDTSKMSPLDKIRAAYNESA
ncbi:MAG: hypothetical protein QNJ71_11685 [Acidimicrobiia bacterium]|nr:hypothetical protein [Acidimicrobiia bacterium]